MDGVDAAISAWTADLCDATMGKDPSQEEERKYATLVKAAQERELAASKEFDVFRPVAPATNKKTIANTR